MATSSSVPAASDGRSAGASGYAGQESFRSPSLIFAALAIPEGSGSHGEQTLPELEEVLAGSYSTAGCLGGDPRAVLALEYQRVVHVAHGL